MKCFSEVIDIYFREAFESKVKNLVRHKEYICEHNSVVTQYILDEVYFERIPTNEVQKFDIL